MLNVGNLDTEFAAITEYWSPRVVFRRWRRWMNSGAMPVAPGSAASASARRRCAASGLMVFGAWYSCTYSQTRPPSASA